MKTKIFIGVIVATLIAGFFYINSLKKERDDALTAYQQVAGDSAKFIRLTDSLGSRVVKLEKNLHSKVSENSQLKKELKERDEKIKFLSSIEISTEANNISVGIKDGHFKSESEWFNIEGEVGSDSTVDFHRLEFRDSLYLAVVRSTDDLLTAYIGNSSPFTKINNFEFSIDLSEYLKQKELPWYNEYAIWIAAGAILVVEMVRSIW